MFKHIFTVGPVDAEHGDSVFKVFLTGDFRTSAGDVYFEAEALKALQSLPESSLEILKTPVGLPLTADLLASCDAVIMKRSPVTADVLERGDLKTIHISRNGVGLEHLDLAACTKSGIMVTNTPESVRRPMASSTMTLILALAHRLLEKNRAVREGRWADRHRYHGIGLRGRILGLIGCGNIGRDFLGLAAPWGMQHLVYDPHQPADMIISAGAEPVDLDTLLTAADFVVVCCPLTDETHHIIDRRALGLMKQGSFLVNVARGPLVEERALIDALQSGRLAGAGLDVFDPEPPEPDNPLLSMDTVIATGHNLGFSDESNRVGNTRAADAVVAVAQKRVPPNLVNPEVLDHPRVKDFLATRR